MMAGHATGRQPDFDIDLRAGLDGERWVKDIVLSADTAEVKTDFTFPRTGNLYVEYECKGRDGMWRPSGIATTKADVWVHILGPPGPGGTALVVDVDRLKDVCRPLLRAGHKAEEKDGSNPTKGVLVNGVELIAGLSPLALEGARRRQERLGKGTERTCVSCTGKPVRMWAVPDDYSKRYGQAVPYCELCEPFDGEPLSEWVPPKTRAG